jgi:hypothetical protein
VLPPTTLALLALLGLVVRVGAALGGGVLARDGIAYLAFARLARDGEWAALGAAHYPPGYPVLVAALSPALGLDERGAALASALVGALLAPAMALLAAPLGRRAAVFTGLLGALLPVAVELGSAVQADGLHLTLVASTLVLLQRLHEGRGCPWAAALGAAVAGGLAYLTRPEALVVVGAGALGLLVLPRPAGVSGPGRRVADVARLALPAVAVALPYLLVIQAHAVLGGEAGAGSFKLTLKQNLPQILAAVRAEGVARNAFHLVRHALAHLAVAAPGGLVALAGWGAWSPAARRQAARLALTGAALLLAFAVVRDDRRYAAQLALLALPSCGLGLARLARALPWRPDPLAVGVATALVCLPLGLRDHHARKATWREVGLSLRGCARVVAEDSRAAFYAGAEDVTAAHLPDPRDAAALVELARARGADALVVPAAASPAVAALLGPPVAVFRPDDAEALDVFRLR